MLEVHEVWGTLTLWCVEEMLAAQWLVAAPTIGPSTNRQPTSTSRRLPAQSPPGDHHSADWRISGEVQGKWHPHPPPE